jgi:hypothetical protein
MTALVRAELVGLHTLRSTYVVPLAVVALAAAIAGFGLSDAGTKGMTTPGELREAVVAGAGIITAVALSIFAAMRVAGEYRHDTITLRLLASPRRARVLSAELLTYGTFALVVGGVALGTALAIAEPQLAAKDLSLALSAGLVGGVLLAVVLFTLIGVLAGVITRSQPAAVVAVVGAFFAEKIVGLVAADVTAYLPYGLLNPLLGLDGATISRGTAALSLAAITAALGVVAYVLLTRRDVT